jgi:hypothetical protein
MKSSKDVLIKQMKEKQQKSVGIPKTTSFPHPAIQKTEFLHKGNFQYVSHYDVKVLLKDKNWHYFNVFFEHLTCTESFQA